MRKIFLALTATFIALPVLAAPGGNERQQAFKKMLLEYEPMGIVVRGDNPYDKDVFIRNADAFKRLAKQPFTLFPPGSIDAVSRAKPGIWSQPALFAIKRDNFLNAVEALDTAAHAGDLTLITQRYLLVEQSCKACHEIFRGPKR